MTASKEDILRELDEVQKDLQAFKEARDAIQRRSVELENDQSRQDKFVGWAVTQIVLNGLLLGIVKCEGLLDDYRTALERCEPATVLTLVPNKETTDE